MRRPVVFLFLFFAFGIALEYRLMLAPFHLLAASLFTPAVYFTIRIIRQRQEHNTRQGKNDRIRDGSRLVCFFILVLLLGCDFFYFAENNSDPLETQVGKRCTVEGRIITIQVKDDTYWQMLITSGLGEKRLIQVKGSMEDPAAYIGKRVVISGKVIIPPGQRNPGLFDYGLYLKTKSVRVILQSSSEELFLQQEHSSMLFSMLARLKYGFLSRLEKEMDQEAFGLMAGMLFGDCSLISEDTYEAFQKNGVAHILSVSGIHVGIVYLYLSRLLGNRKTRTFYLLAALLLLIYAALSEFSPSVVRAVVMIIVHMFSKVSYRRYDFISCTAASALGMLLVNPFYLFNAGFQLSFMAVFCLAAALPWTNRRIVVMEENGKSEILTIVLRSLSPLLIIQIGMAPVTAYLFNYFSIVSIIINIPVIAISGIIIPLGILLIPVSFIGGFLFGIGAMASELMIQIMLSLNELFFLPGIGFFNMTSPLIFLLLIFYGFFFFLFSEFFRILYQRKKKNTIQLCCSLILLLSFVISVAADDGYRRADLVFLDVGQGDCLYIRTPEGRNILIDGGGSRDYKVGEKILLPYLLKNGVKSVDLAIATHLHDDHYLGLKELAGKMEIKRFGTYEANRMREREILEQTGLESGNLIYLAEGDRLRIGKEVWIDVLYPVEQTEEDYKQMILEEKDENRSSLLLKISYGGLTLLMTGDLGLEGEQEILEHYKDNPEALEADILKIGHHGSRYSTGDLFLETVSPKMAVFQVGKNNFGHPHPTIIEKCSKKGIIVYRNDQNGAIIFEEEGQQWRIKVLHRQNMHIKE